MCDFELETVARPALALFLAVTQGWRQSVRRHQNAKLTPFVSNRLPDLVLARGAVHRRCNGYLTMDSGLLR